ncbi:hypothetical protein VKT23_008475 [Stygiomarasmius scandens]|uniref:Uncharacterized protein n=1 Tax=Marasmiellus scandens TaxID=2682957 RepID=A0ABR1JHF0_9AGAR
MLEKSSDGSAARDHQAITYTFRSLCEDNELVPLIEAIPDLVYGPNGVRSANLCLITPLLESSVPEMNILFRITDFMGKCASWNDPTLRARCTTACPKAIWCLAYMLIQVSSDKMSLSGIDSLQASPIARGAVRILKSSSILSTEFSTSALALVRLSQMYSLRRTLDLLEELLENNTTEKLEEVMKVLMNTIDMDWSLFPITIPSLSGSFAFFDLLVNIHLLAEERTFENLENTRQNLAQLRGSIMLPWDLVQAFILSEYLTNSVKARSLPYEFAETCNALFPRSFVEDDVITGDKHDAFCAPISQFKSVLPSDMNNRSDTVFIYSLRLFCLNQSLASSSSPGPAECREIIQRYIASRSSDVQAMITLCDNDQSHYMEFCVLQDLRQGTGHPDACLRATLTLLGNLYNILQSRSETLSRLLQFGKDVFAALKNPVSSSYYHHILYPFIRNLSNLTVCIDMIAELEARPSQVLFVPSTEFKEKLRVLLRDLLPSRNTSELEGIEPEWSKERLGSLIRSVTLAGIAKYVDQIADYTLPEDLPFYEQSFKMTCQYFGLVPSRLDDESQILFAQSIERLTNTRINFFPSIFTMLAQAGQDWLWLDCVEAARIIAAAIGHIEGSSHHLEQSRRTELFFRCLEVIDGVDTSSST